MLLIQSVLVGVFCYLGALSVPWPLGLITGWYTITRPLVSGLILGLIFGDVQQGIIMGVAIQAVYIALVTPGGVMPADLNFVAYPAMALALVSNASTEVAVTLAASIGVLGTVIHNSMMVINSYWGLKSEKAIEEGDQKGLFIAHIVGPQIGTFLLRFIPTVAIIYFAAQYFETVAIESILPTKLIHIMTVLGGILPALGIATLLTQIVHKDSLLLYFLVGFVGVVFLNLNTLALLILGAFFALFHIEYSKDSTQVVKASASDEEEF